MSNISMEDISAHCILEDTVMISNDRMEINRYNESYNLQSKYFKIDPTSILDLDILTNYDNPELLSGVIVETIYLSFHYNLNIDEIFKELIDNLKSISYDNEELDKFTNYIFNYDTKFIERIYNYLLKTIQSITRSDRYIVTFIGFIDSDLDKLDFTHIIHVEEAV